MNNIFADNALKFYENGYNVLPVEPNSKAIYLPNWQSFCTTKQAEYQINSWVNSYANHNIGIPLGSASNIIALDFDDNIDGLHEKIEQLTAGSLVKKKGLKGFTAFYRYNGEIPKKWRKDGHMVVELLSTGNQTVVPPSMHPDTKQPYQWLTDDTLLDCKPDELSTLPTNFIEQVDKLFGYEQKIIDFNNTYGSGELPDLAEVEKALTFVPSGDYATWITIGMALQHNYGDKSYAIWDGWSRKAPNYNEKGMSYKWQSFGKYTGNPVTIGTIFHYAMGYGYIVPRIDPEFEVDSDFKLIFNGVDLITGQAIEQPQAEQLKVNDSSCSTINTNIVNNDTPQITGSMGGLEFPQHLLDSAPGLPGMIASWINSTAIKRQPVLALGAAICAAGTLFAHKVRNDSNLRTNFMVLGLAESGAGKNHARECIKSLFFNAEMENQTLGKFASDAGLINALHENNGVGISLMDEIGREIQSINTKGAGSHESRLITLMMEIYSEAGTYYDCKRYANSENNKKLVQPLLNIYGTTVPKRFFDSMTSDEAIDGFLARWLIFQSDDVDPPMQTRGNIDNVPVNLMNELLFIRDMPIHSNNQNPMGGYVLQSPPPSPPVIQYTEGAKLILDQFSKGCNDNRLSEIKRGGLLAPIWGRAREHAIKLALVAHPYREGIIESVTMQWACEMAFYLMQVAIKTIEDNVTDTDHEKILMRVYNIIKRWCDRNGGGFMPNKYLCMNVKFIKSRERNEILTQLSESGMIEVQESTYNNKTSYSYKAISY